MKNTLTKSLDDPALGRDARDSYGPHATQNSDETNNPNP